MKNIEQLIKAINEKKSLVWNTQNPVENIDYNITWIEELDASKMILY
jgi:hypothetical protein